MTAEKMIATQREATTAIKRVNTGASFHSFGPAADPDFEFEGSYAFPDGTVDTYNFWHNEKTGNLLFLLKKEES